MSNRVIPIRELRVGDTINSLIGHTLTVTDIELVEEKFCTPKYVITFYTNIDDSMEEYKKSYPFNEYVTIIE